MEIAVERSESGIGPRGTVLWMAEEAKDHSPRTISQLVEQSRSPASIPWASHHRRSTTLDGPPFPVPKCRRVARKMVVAVSPRPAPWLPHHQIGLDRAGRASVCGTLQVPVDLLPSCRRSRGWRGHRGAQGITSISSVPTVCGASRRFDFRRKCATGVEMSVGAPAPRERLEG